MGNKTAVRRLVDLLMTVVLILLMVAATMANNYFTKRAAKGRNLV